MRWRGERGCRMCIGLLLLGTRRGGGLRRGEMSEPAIHRLCISNQSRKSEKRKEKLEEG